MHDTIDDFQPVAAEPPPFTRVPDSTGAFVTARDEVRWQHASDLVEQQYARCFGASPNPDYPLFLGMEDSAGLPLAVIGARPAGDGPTFCENYLDQDLAALLASKSDEPISRNMIVELGNLAIRSRQQLIPLMRHVQQWAIAQDFGWIVFCLTRQLRAWFEHLGIQMISLVPAGPDRIASSAAQWGSYYQHEPFVLAARVDQCPGFIRPAP